MKIALQKSKVTRTLFTECRDFIKGQALCGLTGCGDSFQGYALWKILGSSSGIQPYRLGCPEVKLGRPSKKKSKIN